MFEAMLEEELKNRIGADYFSAYDTTKIVGRIDFSVSVDVMGEPHFFLWAEAKQGKLNEVAFYRAFAQLVLTIGKARTFDLHLPPPYLGMFDAEKIAFIPYDAIQRLFYINDFDWTVTSSNYETREFTDIYALVETQLDTHKMVFRWGDDDKDLRTFIADNFNRNAHAAHKLLVDKNNFITVYNKWQREVQPSIAVVWDGAKKAGVIDGDFYLADLLSDNNQSLKESLYVLLKHDKYEFDRKKSDIGFDMTATVSFNDGQKAHKAFWNRYKRPPQEEYWDYIVERRDLLVPQDVRERKGSYFTPSQWVELSQQYITDVLGENWQDEYYVWDCAAGTGNLLAGLVNPPHVFASTLDKADVDVMHDRISSKNKKSILLRDHVFQFDFLNDKWDKLPEGLRAIIKNEEKRKKLVIYINPPYVETASARTMAGTGENRKELQKSMVNENYKDILPTAANREMFIQFLIRMYMELSGCKIAIFSKIKGLQSPNFKGYRISFRPKLLRLALLPAHTFDNVKGKFPIGFQFWDSEIEEGFQEIVASCYDESGEIFAQKTVVNYDQYKLINEWIVTTRTNVFHQHLGFIACLGNDFQHNNLVHIMNHKNQMKHPRGSEITEKNLIPVCIYLSVRKVFNATWLNDRDQFLAPINGWQEDKEFQNNCLIFTLFNSFNTITLNQGTNHWIPFTEQQVGASSAFESDFMTRFMQGKLAKPHTDEGEMFDIDNFVPSEPLIFSAEATAVMDAGRELWRYYHTQAGAYVNASYYDIKLHFQGKNDKGKMKSSSDDQQYTTLLKALRQAMEQLRQAIQPKVYEYRFLLR